MAFKTNARRANRTQPTDTQTTDNRGTATRETRTNRGDRAKTGQRLPWDDAMDRNGDGRIDFDDLLHGAKEIWQWVFSWRGGMVLCAGFTVFAASINIASWTAATGSFAAGFLTWGMIQVLELMPAFDGMSLKANLAALVRLQRKPVSIPVVNQTLNPAARSQFRRYRNREKKQGMVFEAVKWICYAVEFAVLVVAGGILAPTGISWYAALLAVVGIVGPELGLELTNICAEKLMTPDEREFIRSLEASVRRTSVTVPDDN